MKVVILGIETSCDETGAALLVDGKITADRTTTQLLHEKYGGVVPELASRAHMSLIAPAVNGVFEDSGINVDELDAVAATYGPGLAGALLVGVSYAKGLAQSLNIPFIGINHLEGHLWAGEMAYGELPTPFIALIISGGHTLMIEVNGLGQYRKIGGTHDDAVGELFDKTGRMLGFPFPAGAKLDADSIQYRKTIKAKNFNVNPVHFPRAKIKKDEFGFSFSGLKTAVLYYLQDKYSNSEKTLPNKYEMQYDIPDYERIIISAAIMEAVSDMLITGLEAAWDNRYRSLVVSGGAASSSHLRTEFSNFAKRHDIPIIIPSPELCTDNGSMIAWIAYKHFINDQTSPLSLQVDPSASLFKC
ncbi:tRNA (adenosine(37)-N6)-threonylcarbamoyltransferase complex transferase subunit TsaD [bacterium]|nr:tRNA (adenosine(37)-N6)-threonylcarbamoyltransferase complex transferase subunit TsaD [bacterium]